MLILEISSNLARPPAPPRISRVRHRDRVTAAFVTIRAQWNQTEYAVSQKRHNFTPK